MMLETESARAKCNEIIMKYVVFYPSYVDRATLFLVLGSTALYLR